MAGSGPGMPSSAKEGVFVENSILKEALRPNNLNLVLAKANQFERGYQSQNIFYCWQYLRTNLPISCPARIFLYFFPPNLFFQSHSFSWPRTAAKCQCQTFSIVFNTYWITSLSVQNYFRFFGTPKNTWNIFKKEKSLRFNTNLSLGAIQFHLSITIELCKETLCGLVWFSLVWFGLVWFSLV